MSEISEFEQNAEVRAMVCSLTDFDQHCHIVTCRPARRTGPMRLRAAVRSIVSHRPLADTVEIELGDGTRLEEVEIDALYEIACGAIHLPDRAGLRAEPDRNPAPGTAATQTPGEAPRSTPGSGQAIFCSRVG